MELRQLKYFVKVADTLNFSEAAKALFVSQSTLSQQIKQLEGELGVQLFTRSSHNVGLTEAGSELLPYARQTIIDSDLCTARIADLNALAAGTLNIGVTYSFSPILTESLLSFMKAYPRIKLNIYYRPTDEIMDMLRRREVDFVLAFRPHDKIDGIESHILFQNYLSAVVSEFHPLATLDKVSLDELAQYDIALPTPGMQPRSTFDLICGDITRYKVRIELNDVNILLSLLRSSMLVSILAEATTHNQKSIKAIPIDTPDGEMAGCVHILKDSYRKHSMQEFIRLLSESIAVRERQNAWI